MKNPLLLIFLIALPVVGQIVFEDQSTLFNYLAPSYQAVAFGDYDLDGYLDIFQANILGSAFLFHNNQGHSYANAIASSGLDLTSITAGGFWADFDNDRLLDLFVSGYTTPNRLYKNNGDGTFTDLSQNLPIEPYNKLTYTAALADYDNDGYVDIFVVNFTEGNKDQLLHNNGDMTFADVTAERGFSAIGNGKTRCAAWCDYDGDGDADIFVGGQRQSVLFVNQGDGTFSPTPLDVYDTRVAVWVDYDQDGDFDLTVCNGGANNPLILINENQGAFTKTTFIPGATGYSLYYSPLWKDFDNDGDLDLLLFGNFEGGRGLKLLKNDNLAGFSDATANAGLDPNLNGYSINAADVNNDGRVDLIISEVSQRKSLLCINQSQKNNWLQLELAGSESNFSAIGTVVHFYAGKRQQVFQLESNGPGACSLVLEFGLGATPSVDSLVIHWPSGKVQIRENTPANQRLQITESEGAAGRDSGIERVLVPSTVIQGSVINPEIILKNYGAAEITNIWAQCLIDSSGITSYHNLQYIDRIAPLDTCLVRFAEWTPHTPSFYRANFSVYLVGDLRPANNTRTYTVRSAFDHDVSIKNITSPRAGSNVSGRIYPEIEIENAGVQPALPFEVICEITNGQKALVYRNTYMVAEMPGMMKKTITFAPWTPAGTGPFTVNFAANSTPDQYPANNVARITVNFQTEVQQADATQPNNFLLLANYPNPFNSRTTIRWQAPVSGRLCVRIFSSTGVPVRSVQDGLVEAGEHRVTWNGENDRNESVASGIYFCRAELINVQGMQLSVTAKMVLLK